MTPPEPGFRGNLTRRRRKAAVFHALFAACVLCGIALLGVLVFRLVSDGWSRLSLEFLQNAPSRFPDRAGIKPALMGTLWLIGFTALISIPVGVAAAVYLEEYARKGRLARFLEMNIANLAGVPSIVYGMLGLVIFVRGLALGRSVIAGALTLSLLVLPVVIIASREALKAVPSSLRQAAWALGGTRWQTTRSHVLPAALPGILTGVILALSRAIGETAPLIMIGALTYVAFVPSGPMDGFTAMPIQVFNWSARPQPEFHAVAAAGILVLLAVMLVLNLLAVVVRHRAEKKIRW